MSLVPCWDDAATKAAEQVLARRLQCSHWHPAKTPEMRCCDFRHSCGTSCCPSKRTTIEASANLGNFQTWHEDVCLDRQRHSLFCSIGTGGWSLSDTPFSIVPAVVASDFDSSSSEEESEPLGFVGCVRCCLHPPITGHGHPRQANCPRLALAERLRRKTDRIDPTRVCRPYCRPGRSAFRQIASRGSMTQPLNPSRSARRSLSPNVAVLGVVSLLMGMSSAMIYGLLPVFLVTVLGATTAAVGLIEGTAEATTSLVKIFSGVVSDWIGRRKPLVALGYGLSAVNKLLFPFAESASAVLVARIADRLGKGMRDAPRDALLADVTPAAIRGTGFGLRLALYTVGAVLGPLTAIALMTLSGDNFRLVFWVALIPGFASLVVLLVGVKDAAAFRFLRLAGNVRKTVAAETVAGDEAGKKPVVMELVPRPQLRLRAREDEVRAVRGAPVP